MASRRHAEELITQGRVYVNGRKVTQLGSTADPAHDRIEVDGKRIHAEKFEYILLHKPKNVVTTLRDPEGRTTVADLLTGVMARVVPVGRLDYATSGALLLTNDGDLTARLLHPRFHVSKVYVAKVQGKVDQAVIEKLALGVRLPRGGSSSTARIELLRYDGRNSWLEITLHEGKNRQIHRMFEAMGYRVMRLARVSFAGLTTQGLRPGEYRSLTRDEIAKLKASNRR